jgi:hypothetical protein
MKYFASFPTILSNEPFCIIYTRVVSLYLVKWFMGLQASSWLPVMQSRPLLTHFVVCSFISLRSCTQVGTIVCLKSHATALQRLFHLGVAPATRRASVWTPPRTTSMAAEIHTASLSAVEAPPSAAAPTPVFDGLDTIKGRNDAADDRFLAWCLENGVSMPKLQYPFFDEATGVRGLGAKCDIFPGDTLITVPEKLMITAPVACEDPELGPVFLHCRDIFDVDEDVVCI